MYLKVNYKIHQFEKHLLCSSMSSAESSKVRDDLFFWLLDCRDGESATGTISGILLQLTEVLVCDGDLVGNDVSNVGRGAASSTAVLFSEAIAAKLQSDFAAWKFVCILSLLIFVSYEVRGGAKLWEVRYAFETSKIL